MAYVILLAGLVTALGGYKEWDWFMNHRKARFFVNIFGRNGARLFYIILGLAISGVGIAGITGLVNLSNR
jgi:hypothetical protein